jgi:hypothetical protein
LIEGFGSREHVGHVAHIGNIPLSHRLVEGFSTIKHAWHVLDGGYIPAIQSFVEGWQAGEGERHVSDVRHVPAVKDVSVGRSMWTCIPVIVDGLLKASSIWEIWDWHSLGILSIATANIDSDSNIDPHCLFDGGGAVRNIRYELTSCQGE